MIGAWLQPAGNMQNWESRGVNTMVGYNSSVGNTQAVWDQTAASLGLYTIRPPSANPANDVGDSSLVAWAMQDEPDASGVSPSSLLAQYNSLKSVDPNMPIYTNYSGGYVLGLQGSNSAATYAAYTAATDWSSNDIYPVTGWGQPNNLGWVGKAVSTLSSDSSGKPQYCFIETSNQNLPWVGNERGPTPCEVNGETWDAIIHGARGIVYFPQRIDGGFQYDATPANVVTQITQQDAMISSLAPVICSGSVSNAQSLSFLNSPSLEGTWRIYNGVEYYFVLNLSASALNNVNFTLPNLGPEEVLGVYDQFRDIVTNGDGSVTDSFGPDQVNIYSTDQTLVPEPVVVGPLLLAAAVMFRRPRRKQV